MNDIVQRLRHYGGWGSGQRNNDAADEIERLRKEIERLRKPMTMSDIRLRAGEGKLTPHDVLNAANAVLRMR